MLGKKKKKKKRISDALKRCNINNKHQARCSGAKPTMRERMEGRRGGRDGGGRCRWGQMKERERERELARWRDLR